MSSFFAVLMYALYGHPRYFKFKQKYQQSGPCFQTIFPFLMTMIKETLLHEAVQFAKEHVPITKKDVEVIFHSRKSVLY